MYLGKFACACTALALTAAAAHAQFARQEVLTIESAGMSPADVLTGKKGTKIIIAGNLHLPKADARNAVIVLMPGVGALGSSIGPANSWVKVFNAAGYGTLALDSFSARGISTLPEAQKLPPLSRLPDAFGALVTLSKHPLVDPKRIVVMGLSHGSVAAMYSGLERFQKLHGTGAFAAHISVYGICGTKYRDDEKFASPLLMLHGLSDDWVPAAPCIEYAARLGKSGANARLIEYPDAHHVFDGLQLSKVTKFPSVTTGAHCRTTELDDGLIVNVETARPLTPADTCIVKGPSAGLNEAAMKKAHEDVLSFLKEVLK